MSGTETKQVQIQEWADAVKKATRGLVPESPEWCAAFAAEMEKQTLGDGKRVRQEDRPPADLFREKGLPVFAESERVRLRPLNLKDARKYMEIRAQYFSWYRRLFDDTTLPVPLFLLETLKAERFFCMIEDREGSTVLGYIGIKDTCKERWEIAIELDKPYTGQGYGPHSIALFLRELRRIADQTGYLALVEVDNLPSQKCFERLGARLAGLSAAPFLRTEEEQERFERQHPELLNDRLRELAAQLGASPEKLLSHVLRYELDII